MENLELLEQAIGKEQAQKLLELTTRFEEQAVAYRTEINELLKFYKLEAKVGLSFVEIEEPTSI